MFIKRFIERHPFIVVSCLLLLTFAQPSVAAKPKLSLDSSFETLLESTSPREINSALNQIDAQWDDAYIPQALEFMSLSRDYQTVQRIVKVLEANTGQKFGRDVSEWFYWLWNKPENITKGYAQYKASLYQSLDPHFGPYFKNRQSQALIRLDEIRWGGVAQDGIPPLRGPKMLKAPEATYLDDDNVVFGIEINGDARAYPKRILAWHEMFVDTVGGVDIAGVYCTLCGTVIPYKTQFKGVDYELGTSGFLYRSNKLMYDKATQSLWNTITGEPVVGPLVNKGIALEHLSVVTTTWGEWKRRHPDTKVLSLQTGHRRNYNEGAAYNDYFSHDEMMFNTPFKDKRLKNKQEILALRFPAAPKEQLAIDTTFLDQNPLYVTNIGRQKILVLTDSSGANRVYDPKGVIFVSYDQDSTVTDDKGNKWALSEESLIKQNLNKQSGQTRLTRLPYHRAFWFGWRAAYPETKLIM